MKEAKGKQRKLAKENKKRVGVWTGKHNREIDLSTHTTNPKDGIWVETPENLKRMNVDIVWV